MRDPRVEHWMDSPQSEVPVAAVAPDEESVGQRAIRAVQGNPTGTNIEIARTTGLDKTTVSRARMFLGEASPELVQQVLSGGITFYKAQVKIGRIALPEKPDIEERRERPDLDGRMERALDQLDNAVETLTEFLSEQAAAKHGHATRWAGRLTTATAAITSLVMDILNRKG